MRRALAIALSLALGGCRGEPDPPALDAHVEESPPAPSVDGADAPFAIPPPDAWDHLLMAHHLRWIRGDLDRAKEMLQRVADDQETRPSVRALASLRLAEVAEMAGDRRKALSYLDRVKALAGEGHVLAVEADDRRARILTATPLADVRGPVPGTASIKGADPEVLAVFREAERRLASFHRVVVAPRMENINEVLQVKRRALTAATTLYQRVAREGNAAARVAALFRVGAMYHHMAEALAFEPPPELLPSEARRLRRVLRAEATTYLRRALSSYREASGLELTAPSSWQKMARREAETLAVVLKEPKRPAGGRRGGAPK